MGPLMGTTAADPPDDGGGQRRSAAVPQHDRPSAVDAETDVAAFTAFYRRTTPKLVAFLRWQGASLPDATDCVQDTMIAAFQQWPTLHTPAAWCRLVASRTYARRLASLHEDPVSDVETTGAVLRSDADLDGLEQRHTVLRCLDRLPPRQRQVMAWIYDGATPTEVADALNLTPEAVRSTLYKARATLRAYLSDTGGELR